RRVRLRGRRGRSRSGEAGAGAAERRAAHPDHRVRRRLAPRGAQRRRALGPALTPLEQLPLGTRVVVRYRVEGGFTDALGPPRAPVRAPGTTPLARSRPSAGSWWSRSTPWWRRSPCHRRRPAGHRNRVARRPRTCDDRRVARSFDDLVTEAATVSVAGWDFS